MFKLRNVCTAQNVWLLCRIPPEGCGFVNIVQHGIFCCMCFCLVLLMNYLPFTAPNAVTYMRVTKPAVFHPFARAKNMDPVCLYHLAALANAVACFYPTAPSKCQRTKSSVSDRLLPSHFHKVGELLIVTSQS